MGKKILALLFAVAACVNVFTVAVNAADDYLSVIHEYIPVNIDGRQGRAISMIFPLEESHIGMHDLVFDNFAPGLVEVNAAVSVGGVVQGYAMGIGEKSGFAFEITNEHIGLGLEVIMSTNSQAAGSARVNIIALGLPEQRLGFQERLDFVNGLLGVEWDMAPVSSEILDGFISDVVDHKALGLILIEDLIEVLDDFNGPVAFVDLWVQFLLEWEGWQEVSPLIFRGGTFDINWPLELDHLPWNVADFVEYVYAILGVNWDAVPETASTLNSLINEGVSHKDFALIMASDFMIHMTDSLGTAEFEDLWQGIIDTNWSVSHFLSYPI